MIIDLLCNVLFCIFSAFLRRVSAMSSYGVIMWSLTVYILSSYQKPDPSKEDRKSSIMGIILDFFARKTAVAVFVSSHVVFALTYYLFSISTTVQLILNICLINDRLMLWYSQQMFVCHDCLDSFIYIFLHSTIVQMHSCHRYWYRTTDSCMCHFVTQLSTCHTYWQREFYNMCYTFFYVYIPQMYTCHACNKNILVFLHATNVYLPCCVENMMFSYIL